MIEKKSFQFCCFNKIRKLLSLRVKVSYSWGLKFLFEKCNLNICETKMFYAMHIEGKYFNLDIPGWIMLPKQATIDDILKSWLYFESYFLKFKLAFWYIFNGAKMPLPPFTFCQQFLRVWRVLCWWLKSDKEGEELEWHH